MNALTLATDYRSIFKDQTAVITGLSRSGTSILGKIVGSMENTAYLFEPVILRLLPVVAVDRRLDIESAGHLLRGIIFEDYYLQLLHGRNLNFNKPDNSFIGHYQDIGIVKRRWKLHRRRGDVMEDLKRRHYSFVLKISEIHFMLPVLEKIFEGLKVIHIIRNGNAIISSSLKRGWYTDDFFNHHMCQWMQGASPKIPWFIPALDAERYRQWNPATRIAYTWRLFTAFARQYGGGKKNYLELRYEDLMRDPETVTAQCEKFLGTRKTKITQRNIRAVKKHAVTQHQDLAAQIDPEERAHFETFMREFGYL